MSIAGPPHSDPPRCPGHTSVSGARLRIRSCSERKICWAPSSRCREVGPGHVVDEQRVAVDRAHGSSPRAVSTSADAVCSGRSPG